MISLLCASVGDGPRQAKCCARGFEVAHVGSKLWTFLFFFGELVGLKEDEIISSFWARSLSYAMNFLFFYLDHDLRLCGKFSFYLA